jgi:hypothetical protein
VIPHAKVAANLPAAQLCQLAFFMPPNERPMNAPTSTIPPQLARNLTDALARLNIARTVGDHSEAQVSERRLNWLLDTHLKRALEVTTHAAP